MKYKVGDKVRIKSKEWWDAQPKNENGNVEIIDYFTRAMSEYCGRTATIEVLLKGKYLLDVENQTYPWTDEMFDDSYTPEKSILSEEMIKDIAEVVKKHNLGVSISENEGKLIIEPLKVEEEEDLPIDTTVMATNVINDWSLRYYAGKGTTFIQGYKSKDNKSRINWVYIIPFDKFNPNNIEESLKYNIVK